MNLSPLSRSPLQQLLACMDGAPPSSTNWEQVIRAANETFTTGSLADALLATHSPIPNDVRSFLLEVRARIAERNKRLGEQAALAVAALNQAEIQPILLKGVAGLFAGSRSIAATRMLSDIDLLVPISSRARSLEALREIGYESVELPENQLMPIVLSRSQDVGSIDLHFIVRPDPRLNFERLLRGATTVSAAGGKAWLPSPTMQVATLVMHDQLHDRDYWRGLIDLRHMLDLRPLLAENLDWDALEALFQHRTSRAALETQLLTAKKLFGLDVPARLTSGRAAMIQYHRRIWQAKWPILFVPATLISMALHRPPRPSNIQVVDPSSRKRWHWRAAAASIMRRFFRAPGLGKI